MRLENSIDDDNPTWVDASLTECTRMSFCRRSLDGSPLKRSHGEIGPDLFREACRSIHSHYAHLVHD